MTHDELLAKVTVENEGTRTKPVFALNALRAVVELHKPNHTEYQGTVCSHCTSWEYPCPTIQYIEKELS